jgi:hypothetical protein
MRATQRMNKKEFYNAEGVELNAKIGQLLFNTFGVVERCLHFPPRCTRGYSSLSLSGLRNIS